MSDYHHGDLANALLQSARSVLNEKGIHGLSLRGCAAHAGVSHAAPTYHFKSLRGLLTELAVIAYDEFTATLQARYEEVSHELPRDRLQKVCQAYVDFAIREPQLFELMFSSTPLDFENSRLKSSAAKAYLQLTGVVHPAFDEKGLSEDKREQAEALIWSVVHGYASLILSERGRHGECSDSSKAVLPDLSLLGELL
ncbi:MAG: AcrR family transcriptional regulator [Gammaproteobacteria bacterium]|jgi:AcrR family transcriptional regulator